MTSTKTVVVCFCDILRVANSAQVANMVAALLAVVAVSLAGGESATSDIISGLYSSIRYETASDARGDGIVNAVCSVYTVYRGRGEMQIQWYS